MIRIGAVHIHKGKIPEKLAYETNALFLAWQKSDYDQEGDKKDPSARERIW